MKALLERVKREPALVVGLLVAIFALLAAFGFELTKEQTGAITAVVIAIMAFVTRSQVTPNVSVAAEVKPSGQVVTGAAAPPAGDPAAVVTSEDGTGLENDERAGY